MNELAVVADDHAPTRSGIRMSLEDGGFVVCAEASDARGAVRAAEEHAPDVCLLDVDMPGGGIVAAAAIVERVPATAVVMLTVSVSDDDLFDSLRAGASGYLLKDTDPDRLPHAIRGVLAGEAALPRTLVARLVTEFRRREASPKRIALQRRGVRLSRREWEVLELLAEGRSTGEVAQRLDIAAGTVRRHVSAILSKTGAPDRAALHRLLQRL